MDDKHDLDSMFANDPYINGNKHKIDEDEINKIQSQINNDLQQAEPSATAGLGLGDRISPETPTVSVHHPAPDYVPQPDYTRAYASPPPGEARPTPSVYQALQNAGATFYSETVKNDISSQKKGKFKRAVALVCIASLLGGSCIGLFIGVGNSLMQNLVFNNNQQNEIYNQPSKEAAFSFDGDKESPKTEIPSANSAPAGTSLADMIEKIEPSVVSISTTKVQSDMFNQQSLAPASGSGILFFENDTKYYVATNCHVIENSTEISISIEGSELIPISSVLGSDRDHDLAVISISKEDAKKVGINEVTLASFGESDSMRVGDSVFAIGNALGEGNSTTNGIISAVNKEIELPGLPEKLVMIQTNAAINPGNSGGPLINMKGEVIGINTAKISQEANAEGMGYSIPSNIAKPIIEEFMELINKPFLGVSMENITPEMSAQFNLPTAGVLVMDVTVGSAAEKAGVQRKDIITGFNGLPVLTKEDLSEAVKQCKIGDTVEVKLIRNGKDNMTIKATLTERP